MDEQRNDDRYVRLLREIGELSEEASLTGNLKGGARAAVDRYNMILRYLIVSGQVPDEMFNILPDDTTFAQLCVESRLLVSFIEPPKQNKFKGDKSNVDSNLLLRLAPFVEREDLTALLKEYLHDNGSVDTGMIANLAPFLDSRMLGQLLREQFARKEPTSPPASPAQPEERHQAATRPAPEADREPVSLGREIVAADSTPVRVSLSDLAERLRRPGITQEEQEELAYRLELAMRSLDDGR
jgi:hypothetical protein